MNPKKIILAGGFLGSGKTTALQQAARLLQSKGIEAGIITNDQGERQVDTAFIQQAGFEPEEVAGGCFCCRFDALEEVLASLESRRHPSIILAEAVGSCVDLVATVINPLARFHPNEYETVLSVFADVRILLQFLAGSQGPFHEQVNYIYRKQLEEADVLTVNKFDLLKEEDKDQAKKILTAAFPEKTLLFQNSRDAADIERWLETCITHSSAGPKSAAEVDYDIYGRGETRLAWLDKEMGISTANQNVGKISADLLQLICSKLLLSRMQVGHLKFLLDDGRRQWKLGLTAGMHELDTEDLPQSAAGRMIILLNARVQCSPDELQRIVEAAVLETESSGACQISDLGFHCFTPGLPQPQHRIP